MQAHMAFLWPYMQVSCEMHMSVVRPSVRMAFDMIMKSLHFPFPLKCFLSDNFFYSLSPLIMILINYTINHINQALIKKNLITNHHPYIYIYIQVFLFAKKALNQISSWPFLTFSHQLKIAHTLPLFFLHLFLKNIRNLLKFFFTLYLLNLKIKADS